MSSLDDFDRYCEEHDVQPGQYGAAFGEWLAKVSGETIIGGPATRRVPHGAELTRADLKNAHLEAAYLTRANLMQ